MRAGCWYEVAPVSERQWPSRYKQRVGARWTDDGAVRTAKARAAWLNNEWDAVTRDARQLLLAT